MIGGISCVGICGRAGVRAGEDDPISRLAHSSSAMGAYLDAPPCGGITGESSRLGSDLGAEATGDVDTVPCALRRAGGALPPSVAASASLSRSTDHVLRAVCGSSVQLRIRRPTDASSASPSDATRAAASSVTSPGLGSAAELLLVADDVADSELPTAVLVAWEETMPSSRFPRLALLNAFRMSADEKARTSFL